MVKLSSRFAEEVRLREAMLSSAGPLSVLLKGATAKTPLHPQLECDFYFSIENSAATAPVLFYSKEAILTGFDAAPAQLQWGYMAGVLGIPQPQVAYNKGKISFMLPSATLSNATPSEAGLAIQKLLAMYEEQFSSRGILQLPDRIPQYDMSVGLFVRFRNKDMELVEDSIEQYTQPLFALYGLRFDSPVQRFNPGGDGPLVIELGFSYLRSAYLSFTQVEAGLRDTLSDDFQEILEDQLLNRKNIVQV